MSKFRTKKPLKAVFQLFFLTLFSFFLFYRKFQPPNSTSHGILISFSCIRLFLVSTFGTAAYIDGKPSWYKLAYIRTEFKKKTVYDLQVTLRHSRKGPQMIVRCNGSEFGCAMPKEFTANQYHVGLIACEGVNRFYDFRVR